ncbi:hypothetical protein J8273_0800 [Carpediemonas membranifera]|uniref:Uncharacterized protein n=1 Tax=Carpediemonas membranifera TaxID=201153 RepID=A0A8J6B269_9EUKA|nr:hypothetical protein J8273_0800 [Carpediemonas membranifera]|eukprot:KAG9397670.1 hypothetical protein J8273_0800 [Carpediemonas membranifera]
MKANQLPHSVIKFEGDVRDYLKAHVKRLREEVEVTNRNGDSTGRSEVRLRALMDIFEDHKSLNIASEDQLALLNNELTNEMELALFSPSIFEKEGAEVLSQRLLACWGVEPAEEPEYDEDMPMEPSQPLAEESRPQDSDSESDSDY